MKRESGPEKDICWINAVTGWKKEGVLLGERWLQKDKVHHTKREIGWEKVVWRIDSVTGWKKELNNQRKKA